MTSIQNEDLYRYQLLFDEFKKHQKHYYLDTNQNFICCDFVGEGFENKMRRLLSNILLAIMTERTLCVYINNDMTNVVCNQCRYRNE